MSDITTKMAKKPISLVNFDVLEKKWRSFFRFLDVDNDRSVTEADFSKMAERMISSYGASGSKATDIRLALKGWWNVFKMQVGSTRTIATEEEYVRAIKRLFLEDRTVFIARTRELADSMFDSIDVSGDGVISRTEYVKMMEIMGVKNLSYIGRAFDRLDTDKSGVLNRGEFLEAVMQFNMNDDEKNNMGYLFNIPKEA